MKTLFGPKSNVIIVRISTVLYKGPSIKDVGIFQGRRGFSNSDVARYYKVEVR